MSTGAGATYGYVVVAIPLTEVQQTLSRLLTIELIVTVTVLAGLGALAWWLVRRELRPLDEMATTAGRIAAGDLSDRVAPAEHKTEVGRLGLALNAMLEHIELAFAERRASEDRCAASSPTPRTSCARRSPRSAATPRCSIAAPRRTPKISPS